MGTSALTRVYDEQNRLIVTLLKTYDGFPEVHGRELADFLLTRQMVNGFGRHGAPTGKVRSNGMGHLAIQMVEHFFNQHKDEEGSWYLLPDCSYQRGDYLYDVRLAEKELVMSCVCSYGEVLLYTGKPEEYNDGKVS